MLKIFEKISRTASHVLKHNIQITNETIEITDDSLDISRILPRTTLSKF